MGVIASCTVSPLVSVFLIAGLICIPLALLCPPISLLLGYGLNAAYRIIFALADFFARMPLITLETGAGRLIFSAAAFAIGICCAVWAYCRNKRVIARLPLLT